MATRKRSPVKRPAIRNASGRVTWQHTLILGVEVAALTAAALILIIAALGRTAERFAGTGLLSSLLPFAAIVLGLALATTLVLKGWLACRAWLLTLKPFLPALAASILALWTAWFAAQDAFYRQLSNFRTLVGGTAEAERTTIAHQVFAAYRRADLYQYQLMWERSRTFLPVIKEAAKVYSVDEDVLVGVGAAESSFRPRDSKDGGRGLFQITAPPKTALAEARKHLDAAAVDLRDHRHNTFVAAATLSHYLAEMKGDLFLGLLAYNIGPRNGGLLSIMSQYHARDFVTIQPYLQHLPRDYPVRVLTAALAYRLWRTEGKLPKYEEGSNAVHIQRVGIPGLG
jgi:soluble lytic murein transglycosylase-like protein